MNVAIVIPIEWHAAAFTVDPRLLVLGFAELGHGAKIVCPTNSTFPPNSSVLAVEASRLGDDDFWHEQAFDLIVVFTWLHSHHAIVASAARSRAFVVSKGDTHGRVGVRADPAATLRLAYHATPGLDARLRNTWFWAKKFVYLDRDQAKPILANLEGADATIVETEQAREGIVRFLRRSGASHLAAKVHVVPNPVASRFLSQEVAGSSKERLVYAVGRWDAHEKNRPLLASVLRRYLAGDTATRAVVVGSSGENVHHPIKHSRIEYVGRLDQGSLADLAAKARICLVTSRWESFHLGAHEALAMGATVVGTPIPVIHDMTMHGAYGHVARTHRKQDVVAALTAEMRVWDEERRDPGTIAMYWRKELAPKSIAARLVGLVP